MIKTKKFMNDIKEVVKSCGPLVEWEDYARDPDYYYNVSCGESHDGFRNFTDGFVYHEVPYFPRRDVYLKFNGFDEESKKNAINVQKVLDKLEDTDESVKLYYRWELDEKLKADFENEDALSKWYKNYEDTDCGDKFYDLYHEIQEFCDNYYEDTPAFIGIAVRVYDKNHSCHVESFFNDDLEYGRESVGAWAGRNIIGQPYGKQVIYFKDFKWKRKSDLLEQLKGYAEKAYKSLGITL